MRTPAATWTFRAAAVLAGLLAAAAAAGIALLLARDGAVDLLGRLPANPWWFLYRETAVPATASAIWRVGAAALGAVLGLAIALRTGVLARLTSSPLAPFLAMFFLSLALEALRAGTALLYADDGSIAAGIVMTRVMYWGRFTGLLALLVAALYAIDLRLRRPGVFIAVVFIVSFAMAAYIPVDRTIFLQQLTWKLGDEQGVWFVNVAIAALVLATSAGAPAKQRDRRWWLLLPGMAMVLAAREALFFGATLLSLGAGLAALVVGAAMLLRLVGRAPEKKA